MRANDRQRVSVCAASGLVLGASIVAIIGCSNSVRKERELNATIEVPLRNPCVVIQLRSGAMGGNPVAVDMLGQKSIYVQATSALPLNLLRPVSMDEIPTVYVRAGSVPPGKVFLITHVEFSGTAAGDTNGHGELLVQILEKTIVSVQNSAAPLHGEWRGRLAVRPGEESKVRVQIGNSSKAEVRFDGEFVNAR